MCLFLYGNKIIAGKLSKYLCIIYEGFMNEKKNNKKTVYCCFIYKIQGLNLDT